MEYFTRSDQIVQSTHRFFQGRVGIRAADLIQVYVFELHSLEAGITSCRDMLSGKTSGVGVL